MTKYSDLYFLRLKPGFRFMVCAHCLRRPPRSNGHPTVVPCIFFSLTAAGLAHSLERRRLVVLFVILIIFFFAGFTSTRCAESLAEKQEEGQKSQASKTTAQEKTC